MKLLQVLLLACVVLFAAQSHAAPTCPVGALSAIKGQRLFLYFPTADDATYPEHGTTGVNTSPLRAFDVANLDAGIGTTDQLRNRIFDFVTDDYCEFSVSVETFTTTPPQTDPRWQQVGIGSDGNGAGLFGEAQAVDTNDVVAQDFARVWSNAFGESFGGAGGALAGANSTLERWATAVSHTVAHEAAHNYGAAHRHSAPRPGSNEDEQNNHVLATGSTGLTGEIRASRDRHFSDQEYEILAHNVGLNIKTLLNWDFVNPNNTNANRLRLRILTTSSTLTLAWFYTGDLSPWTDPTITNTGATQLFQGVTYNVFNLDFSVAKTWSGGVDGVVPPAVRFHVGASFAESGTVFVFDGQLFSDATQLPLFPRMFGFDSGTADLATGDFNVSMFNPSANRGPLIVRQLELLHVPRMVDINTMVANTPPTGLNGVPIDAVKRRVLTHGLPVKDSATIPIARFADKRDLDIIYGPKDCPPGSIGFQPSPNGVSRQGGGVGDTNGEELQYCLRGNALSLFPSTYAYLIATVVDPMAEQWDSNAQRFVRGPLEQKVFYQLGGFVPDFNRNGVDDLIDIRQGQSTDRNKNGLPDEVEQRSDHGKGGRSS